MQIIGDRIIIRPIEKEDLLTILTWWNDPELMYYACDDPNPHKTLQELEEDFVKEKNEWSESMERFVVEIKEGKLIGDIMYHWYRFNVRSVYMGIFIGDKEYIGKGYGTEAIKLFLKYLFIDKKLHKVAITVSDFNKRAIRAYEKCGFQKDGILRSNAIINGEFVDHIVMSILENEYINLSFAYFAHNIINSV